MAHPRRFHSVAEAHETLRRTRRGQLYRLTAQGCEGHVCARCGAALHEGMTSCWYNPRLRRSLLLCSGCSWGSIVEDQFEVSGYGQSEWSFVEAYRNAAIPA